MHYENGYDYLDAGIAIATSDYPDKNFEFHGYFRPFGYMSRDCTIYQEDDKGYFISAANDNADLHVYSMSDDYLNVSECINQLFILYLFCFILELYLDDYNKLIYIFYICVYNINFFTTEPIKIFT